MEIDRKKQASRIRKNTPVELKERDQWCLYDVVPVEGKAKPDKIPKSSKTKRAIDPTDASAGSPFEHTLQAYERGWGDGVGIIITDKDPYVGIDLDKCRSPQTRKVEKWASRIITNMNTYTEISPGETGFHVVAKSERTVGTYKGKKIEIYPYNRFFTWTGRRIVRVSSNVEWRTEALEAFVEQYKLRSEEPSYRQSKQAAPVEVSEEYIESVLERLKSVQGAQALVDGDISAYQSHSEADEALCYRIATLVDFDEGSVDAVFRKTKLYSGPNRAKKWDKIHFKKTGETYGERTIRKGINLALKHHGLPVRGQTYNCGANDELAEIARSVHEIRLTPRLPAFEKKLLVATFLEDELTKRGVFYFHD